MNQQEENQSQEKNQPDAKPDAMQQEPPRTCEICGGPNHHGCGCEAKAARLAAREWPGPQPAEPTGPQPTEPTGPQPAEPTGPQPAESKTDDTLEDILSPDAIREAHEAQMKSYKDIKRMADGGEKLFGHIEAMSDNLSDLCGNLHTVISYLSNCDQSLKEIHAMVKARIRQDAEKGN